MSKCCVEACKKCKRDYPGLTFHAFPREPSTRTEWISRLGLRPDEVRDWSTVCSDHFHRSDFDRDLRAELTGIVPIDYAMFMLCFIAYIIVNLSQRNRQTQGRRPEPLASTGS